MGKHRIQIQETATRQVTVEVDSSGIDDFDKALEEADKAYGREYYDYLNQLTNRGAKIIRIDEGEFDVQEVECDDSIDIE